MASREGHLKFAIYILYYAKKFDKIRIIFNTLNQDHFKYFTETYDKWREFYPDAQEEISHGMSNIKVKYIWLTVYVDVNHVQNLIICLAVTRIVVMTNDMLISGVSMRQNTDELLTCV